jgi:peptidoglycan endopeptidase LytE
VQPGETLSQVAQRYHTSTRSIAQVNGIEEDAVLQKDAKLIIPVTAVRRAAGEGDTVTYSRSPVMHTARKGETALSVADDYAVPVEMVRKWNHLHGNQLRVGQTLRIYKPAGKQSTSAGANSRNTRQPSSSTRAGSVKAKAGTQASSGSKTSAKAEAAHTSRAAASSKTTTKGSSPAAKGKTVSAGKSSQQRVHKVRRGDTLSSIASQYNTTIAALKRDNGKATANLHPGQVLVIK